MTAEYISVVVSVVSVGIALAGLMLAGLRWIRNEFRDLHAEIKNVRQEVKDVNQDVKDLHQEMEPRLSVVERQQAKLEGLLEGLRESITGRRAAPKRRFFLTDRQRLLPEFVV